MSNRIFFRSRWVGLVFLLLMSVAVGAVGFKSTISSAASGDSDLVMINLHVRLRDEAGLRLLVARQQNPESPEYRRWLTNEEFQARFGPTPDACRRVEQWATSAGLTVVKSLNSGGLLVCRAPRKTVETALGLAPGATLSKTGGRSVQPLLPADVKCVEGLGKPEYFRSASGQIPAYRFQDSGFQPQAGCSLTELLNPEDIFAAYNVSQLHQTGIDGSGQKVALLVPGGVVTEDVTAFQNTFKLPSSKIEQHTLGFGAPGGRFTSATAEVEYLSALAPGVTIQAVQLSTNPNGGVSASEMTAALAYAVDKLRDAKVVATGLGVCERSLSQATIDAQEGLLLQAAAQGQTVLAATGDSGADACNQGSRGVLYPASSTLVTAVGGTELLPIRDASDKFVSRGTEIAWNNENGASGGGESAVFKKPSYQERPGFLLDRKNRVVPDVSFHAGGNLTVVVNGVKTCHFGTGVPAAAWAAVFAMVNQTSNSGGLGTVNQTLYNLGTNQTLETGQKVFFDAASGNNFVGSADGEITGPGYDLVTGWGSFDAERFVRNFAAGIPRPGLQLSADKLDFGTLLVGRKSEPLKVNIMSAGAAPLLISSIKLDPDAVAAGFAVESCTRQAGCAPPISLENLQNFDLLLTWTPKTPAAVSGKLVLTTNIPNRNQVEIGITGTGSDDAIPPRVFLGGFSGNETLEPASKVKIQWQSSDNREVVRHRIDFSTDGGATYPVAIASGLSGTATEFEWTVPATAVTTRGKLRIQAFDAAQNIGDDASSGTITIPDREKPTASLETTFTTGIDIGAEIKITWKAADNAGVVSQDLLVLRNGQPAEAVVESLGGDVRTATWTTSGATPGKGLQIRLVVRDGGGNSVTVDSQAFDLRPVVVGAVLEKKAVTVVGFGFKAGADVIVNGVPLDRSVVTVDSDQRITLRGKPKKLRITPGSSIAVRVNGADSKDYIVR